MISNDNPYSPPLAPIGSSDHGTRYRSLLEQRSRAQATALLLVYISFAVSFVCVIAIYVAPIASVFVYRVPPFESLWSGFLQCTWYASPYLGWTLLAVLSRKYLGPAIIVVIGNTVVSSEALLTLWRDLRPLPPDVMFCGPAAIIAWPLTHWVGVAVASIIAAASYGSKALYQRCRIICLTRRST